MPERTFGSELRRLRRSAGLKLADLADAIGCSIVYVSDIERGQRNPPSRESIRKLLAFMGQEERLPEMLTLAAQTRRSIEIPIKNKNEVVADMLTALARRCDAGDLDEETARRILKFLDERKHQ